MCRVQVFPKLGIWVQDWAQNKLCLGSEKASHILGVILFFIFYFLFYFFVGYTNEMRIGFHIQSWVRSGIELLGGLKPRRKCIHQSLRWFQCFGLLALRRSSLDSQKISQHRLRSLPQEKHQGHGRFRIQPHTDQKKTALHPTIHCKYYYLLSSKPHEENGSHHKK